MNYQNLRSHKGWWVCFKRISICSHCRHHHRRQPSFFIRLKLVCSFFVTVDILHCFIKMQLLKDV